MSGADTIKDTTTGADGLLLAQYAERLLLKLDEDAGELYGACPSCKSELTGRIEGEQVKLVCSLGCEPRIILETAGAADLRGSTVGASMPPAVIAEWLHRQGLQPLPMWNPLECMAGRCSASKDGDPCSRPGKHPKARWKHYRDGSRASIEDVQRWWATWPEANVALITGKAYGIAILDCDDPAALAALEKAGATSPLAVMTGIKTADGWRGRQFVFRYPEGADIGTKVKLHIGGESLNLDSRGDGGYGAFIGSLHKSGVNYEKAGNWPKEKPFETAPPFPLHLFDAAELATAKHQEAGPAVELDEATLEEAAKMARADLQRFGPAVEGEGGDLKTFRMAAILVRDYGLADDTALALLLEWNAGCLPPWSEADLRAKIASAKTSGKHAKGVKLALVESATKAAAEKAKPGLLEEAVLVIAGQCDGATSKDGVGFSGADADWFAPHAQAARDGLCIIGALRKRVANRLIKYSGQLFAGGINVNSLVAAEEARNEAINAAEQAADSGGTWSGGKVEKMPPAMAAKQLMTEEKWLFHHERLHVYRDGYYQPDGERLARSRTQIIYGDVSEKKDGAEVVYWLSVTNYRPPETVDADSIINVKNGLLDAKTGKIAPHSPGHLSTIRLPVEWNPAAYHQRFDEFLNEVLPDAETRQILEEALGYLLFPDCRYEKAVMLTGEGQNGKSVFLTAIEAMIGKQNISNLKLQEVGERFSTAQLSGRLANIFADLPKDALADTGAFKMLVSGDRMKAERKHKDPFEFANRAKLWFSANELPKTRDKTTAFWRRWIIVPFPHSFPEGSPKRDPGLKAKLQEPEARSYLLRLAVEGFQRLVARGHFIESQATRHALNQYKVESDNLMAFIDERLMLQDAAFVSKSRLFEVYRDWCNGSGLHPMNKLTLGKELHRLIPSLCESKRTVDGKRENCWVNVGLLDDGGGSFPGGVRVASGLRPGMSPGSIADGYGSCPGVRVDTIISRGESSVVEKEAVEHEPVESREAPIISNVQPTRTPGHKAMDTGFIPGHQPGLNPDTTRTPGTPGVSEPASHPPTVGNVLGWNGAGLPLQRRRYLIEEEI